MLRTNKWYLTAVLLGVMMLSACVSTLPLQVPSPPTVQTASTPAPQPPEDGITPEASVIPDAEPSATPVPTPVPTPPPDQARDLALQYVTEAYQLDLPAPEQFGEIDAATVEVTGMEKLIAYGSGPWLVVVGSSDNTPANALDVLIDNTKSQSRWWGQVDTAGYVITIVSVGMPRPDSKAVVGWKGRVVSLPDDSPYDDYFEGAKGNRHGIFSNDPDIQAILQRLSQYDGRVQVWGELRYAAADYNGRQILVDRIELLDGPLPESDTTKPAESDATATVTAEPELELGPSGTITSPPFGAILVDHVLVSGSAEGVFENFVLVRVELADGEVLGEAGATTNAADIGEMGQYTVDVTFRNPPTTTEGRVALYNESARDGSLSLLAWVNVRFAGAADSQQAASILSPAADSRIKGVVEITGTAVGVHNNRVLVRIEDLIGGVWGQGRTKTDTLGNWQIKITMRKLPTARPGRIAVYDVNPDSGKKVLLSQIEVYLRR